MRSPHPRMSIHHRPKLLKAVSMRFSYFIASMMLPQETPPDGDGTCGTQPGPPGTACVADVITPESLGSPAATRVRSIFAAAAAKLPFRMYASAASRSFSAFMNSGYNPELLALRMYLK